jgi:hypothetical protein
MVASSLRAYSLRVDSQHFPTVGLRAWWAWNCLPRTQVGNLPALRPLERAHELSNGSMRKLIWDLNKRDPSYSIGKRMAEALKCDPDWLFLGVGSGPKASWPVPPRPDRPEALTESDVVDATKELDERGDGPSSIARG